MILGQNSDVGVAFKLEENKLSAGKYNIDAIINW